MPTSDRKRYRLLIGVIVALVILNASLLSWMLMSSRQHQSGRFGNRSYLTKALQLTPEQQEKLKALKEAHFQRIRPLMDSMRQERKRFYQLVTDSTRTDAELLQQARQLTEKSAWLDVLTLRHFQQVSALCTPEQRKKLQQILAERPGFGGFGGSHWSRKRNSDSAQKLPSGP